MFTCGPAFWGSFASGGSGDPDFANTLVLVHGDANLVDTSAWSGGLVSLAESAGGPDIVASPVKWGAGSMFFDGVGHRAAFSRTFTLDDTFTIEVWLYPTSLPVNWCRVVMLGDNGLSSSFCVQFSSTGLLNASVPLGGSTGLSTASGVVTTDDFHHYAVSVDAGTCRIFKDGVLVAGPTAITTPTAVADPGGTRVCYLGADTTSGVNSFLSGYADDFRITLATSRYNAAFTAPIAPFPDA